jgi:hypothetical protein
MHLWTKAEFMSNQVLLHIRDKKNNTILKQKSINLLFEIFQKHFKTFNSISTNGKQMP